MMKKVLALMLASSLVLGCGSSVFAGESASSSEAATSEVTTSEAAASEVTTSEAAPEETASDVELFTENEPLLGGWEVAEDTAVSDDAKAALEKVQKKLLGASYEPVALLATQLVAGLNYCILCKVTPVTKNPVPHYALVYVYEDLSGNAELLDIQGLEIGIGFEEELTEDLSESLAEDISESAVG